MCFKENHLICCVDPLFPGGKDFGDISRQMIMELTCSGTVLRKWTLLRGKWFYVLYLRLVSFRLLRLRYTKY